MVIDFLLSNWVDILLYSNYHELEYNLKQCLISGLQHPVLLCIISDLLLLLSCSLTTLLCPKHTFRVKILLIIERRTDWINISQDCFYCTFLIASHCWVSYTHQNNKRSSNDGKQTINLHANYSILAGLGWFIHCTQIHINLSTVNLGVDFRLNVQLMDKLIANNNYLCYDIVGVKWLNSV